MCVRRSSSCFLPRGVGGELEVLAFAADCDGHILSWYELEGSMQGTDDHRRVLENMGYSL
jgi:hypothetical protein